MNDPTPIASGTSQARRQDARRVDAAQVANGAASVEQAIATAARSTTVDFSYLLAQAQVESGMDPAARASTSSASGLYQFIESTWLDTMRRHGARFGMGDLAAQIETTRGGVSYVTDPAARAAILDLRHDPHVSSLMAAGLAEDNRAHLTPILGREPDSTELYLAHFLGAGGAGRFLSAMQSDPSQSAASLFRRPAHANRAVFFQPDGTPRSLAGVMDHLSAKIGRAMTPVPGGGSALAGVGSGAGSGAGYRSFNGAPAGYSTGLAPPSADPASSLFTGQGALASGNPPARQSMSNLLEATFRTSGASELASPQSAQRIERAYQRLRALGL